jgi:hypothetical protein
MADSTEAATPRLDRGQRKSRGNNSINGAAASRQNLGADPGGGAILSRDDPAWRRHRRLADFPVLGQMHLAAPLMRV